jgi:16S rRNA (cytosine967-C5)-methyltransferase
VGIERPPLTLRSRGDRDALLERLRASCPGARPGAAPGAVLVEGPGEGAALEAVERGEAWVQDVTAQRVAPLLVPRPGQHLLDLCAAPGGKTLHLADLLGTRGEVIACDVDEAKVQALAELRRFVPAGVGLRTLHIPREGPLPFEPASFDGILIDAPCTNTGVLRRRVEVRWRLAPRDIGALAAVQRDLLERSLPLLRPGGRLLYSTCSLESEENRDLVEAFLADHPSLALERMLEVPPSRDADGGFAALLRKA